MSSDIRKWFIKQHDKGKEGSGKHVTSQKSSPNVSGSVVKDDAGNSERRKTSKYFPISSDSERNSRSTVTDETVVEKVLPKRKSETDNCNTKDDVKPSPAKKFRVVDVDDDDEFAPSSKKKISIDTKSGKKSNNVSGVRLKKKSVDADGSDEDDHNVKVVGTPQKDGGRGRGGRGHASAAGGRGGRGGFINFGERKDPPHKGEKEVPEGAPDCLAGLTFVISGTLDSLEREEAEDLIKRHGGRVTGSVSKKTNYLLADEDIGGKKSSKAKELGTAFLTEDGLFDMIRKSKPAKSSNQEGAKSKTPERKDKSLQKDSHVKFDLKGNEADSGLKNSATKNIQSNLSSRKKKISTVDSLTWTEKYRPRVPNDIVGNQSNVKQLHDWLSNWHKEFVHDGKKVKGKKQNDSATKKAVLISGSPGIGKSTSAMLVSQMLGFQVIEVNASDSRGKADSKIVKGVGGSTSNSIKELIRNEALSTSKDWSKYPKSVLIMDEVDGMSAGDRGGVADLIASIKVSKIPIICICNDRYSQKLKSLVNYCLPLNFRKPTKQQMAKRLLQICQTESLQVNEIALEELAERVNGDMRLALNQLQYMALSQSVIKYDDVRERFLSSAKDEDISPFAAVDKLFDIKGGKLRMDERIDLSMSDPDLVPLIIQENYINYRPSSVGKDDNGVKRMHLLAQAAESIADGDIVNVQIRRYRQWQLSQACSFASSIIPAALLHGNRETFEPGERNYNRFGGWLGKNSTTGKNLRLLEDVHIHVLASQASLVERQTLRVDYFSLFIKKLCDPLHTLPKDAAVQMVIEFMNTYSLSQEDFETILELSKFQGHPKPMDGVQPAVKAALTKAYKQDSSRVVRTADLISLPGIKKAPKKRIAALIDPSVNGSTEENDSLLENEESSDLEEADEVMDQGGDAMPQLDLQTDSRKGIQVMLDLKGEEGKSNGRKTPASKPKGTGSASKGGRGGAVGGKRKR
ncbi:hypothetical protein HPP92_001990 [Vanilla planifolia]|uniref:Replication factor C subunit 1 n=1 Tax=Vanilla planifolia TaxID=51239 RepID=A0A835SDT8_VANPL|nr:hypothetical protein HPP92_001990 [Vanilla planifolia]